MWTESCRIEILALFQIESNDGKSANNDLPVGVCREEEGQSAKLFASCLIMSGLTYNLICDVI
jgi:hypothetical protein